MSSGTILYVGNFELPDKGASANRVVSNAKIFESLGFCVLFLGVTKTPTFKGVKQSDDDSRIFEEAYPSSSAEWLEHMISVRNIKTVAEKCDDLRLIILYNVPFSLLVSVKHAFKNTKIAYDCTEWNPYSDGNLLKRKIKSFDEKLIRTKLAEKVDSLIVISKTMQDHYHDSNILLLPPLVDVNDPIWHQERIDHEGFEFCFAGDINGSKERLDAVVEAVSAVDGAKLRVIGVTKSSFDEKYPGLQYDADKVIFSGMLSHSETVKNVISCDCYVFIREKDRRNSAGFPTKFAEAFTSGVPIITTDVSDVSSYMNEKRGIVLSSSYPSSVAGAMKKIMEQPKTKTDLDPAFHYESYIKDAEKWISRL